MAVAGRCVGVDGVADGVPCARELVRVLDRAVDVAGLVVAVVDVAAELAALATDVSDVVALAAIATVRTVIPATPAVPAMRRAVRAGCGRV